MAGSTAETAAEEAAQRRAAAAAERDRMAAAEEERTALPRVLGQSLRRRRVLAARPLEGQPPPRAPLGSSAAARRAFYADAEGARPMR